MGFPLKHGLGTDIASCFQPCQTVCLEYKTSRLYAEVIQIIESRQICWVRPLVLTLQEIERPLWEDTLLEQANCYDLREDSDLLLPLVLFRAALDLEVLPWLANFYADDRAVADRHNPCGNGHKFFREFVQQVWQAHPEIFQSTSSLSKTQSSTTSHGNC